MSVELREKKSSVRPEGTEIDWRALLSRSTVLLDWAMMISKREFSRIDALTKYHLLERS